jgi:hypothetical protein
MFRNRDRLARWLIIFVAAALIISMTLPLIQALQ